MVKYLDLLQDVLDNGTKKEDRTGTGTLSVFGRQVRFDLQKGFPLVTTKKIHMKSIIHELLWFLSGDTNIKYLKDNGVKIWDEWADENGELGPVYGSQWRKWGTDKYNNHKFEFGTSEDGSIYGKGGIERIYIDQISQVINQLKYNPDSRRIIVSAWNVAEIEDMKLPPCHAFFQFYTQEMESVERLNYLPNGYGDAWIYDPKFLYASSWEKQKQLDEIGTPRRKLSCQLYQRSADLFLGVPFNIASYALLTHMVAQQVNMIPGEFIHTFGDTHIYLNHLNQVKEQLSRQPMPSPTLHISRKPDSIFDYKYDDFEITGYVPYPAIKAPVAI